MANEQTNNDTTFWAVVTVNNRVTIPPVICDLKGIDEKKIVRLQVLAVETKGA